MLTYLLKICCHVVSRLTGSDTQRRRPCSVLSDALTAADARQVTLIALLDLTAAFDCVNHSLLLRRLQYNFGFKDDVLRWMTSLAGKTV